jgi:uncharacterized protein (DUF302 family)
MSRRSTRNVPETIAAIRAAAQSKGAIVATVIDHSAGAHAAGLKMPPTRVVIFGNPKIGTPVMLEHPELALDLPLRVLVRDDGEPGSVVTWQDPFYVTRRFGLGGTPPAPLAAVEVIVDDALKRLAHESASS